MFNLDKCNNYYHYNKIKCAKERKKTLSIAILKFFSILLLISHAG